MKKTTLQFSSLEDAAAFSKILPQGFIMNTCNFTLTTQLNEPLIDMAVSSYHAKLVTDMKHVFTYNHMS